MLAVVLRLGRAAAAAEDLLADATAGVRSHGQRRAVSRPSRPPRTRRALEPAGRDPRPCWRDGLRALDAHDGGQTTGAPGVPATQPDTVRPSDRRTVGIEASRPGEVAVAIFQAAARDLDAELERVLEERPQGDGVLAVVSAMCDRLEIWSAQERTEAARVGRDEARRLQETSVPRRVGMRAAVDRDAGVVEEGPGEADEALPGDRSDDVRKVRGG